MDLTTVYDCTGANLGKFDIPPGVLMAAYVTGSDGVPWTPAQLAAHPTAVRIDQSPVNTRADETADIIDVEPHAATVQNVPQWAIDAGYSFETGARPGQRWRTVYVEESEETPVCNALVAAGIKSGVNLFLTKPMPEHAAIQLLENTGGPFPYVGIQYEFGELHDTSLVSTAWLNKVSARPPASQPGPGTQVGWRFCYKCQGLFWGPGESVSHCPVGAQHDGSRSHEYTLGFVK